MEKEKRIAVIDRTLCTREICGYACIHVCPVNRMNKDCIIMEKETNYPVISEQLCVGCGLCPKRCPVSCIKIINLSKDLGLPIYQYGKNSFRLYGLPLPSEELKGAVSLVGKNGLGKTTALQLLSNHIIPNFGDISKKYTLQEAVQTMKPEMKKYFSSLDNNLKISIKPQAIAKLREAFKGKVSSLLSKTIPKEKLSFIIELFNLKNIVNRQVVHLSGGELQKLSIAIAYSKDADIYYFDEISNFLDIYERLHLSILLKDFSETHSVLLVDHDLTLLDYVSNYVYLFYGEESVYGVVSGLKSVRTGINEYLSGYFSSENIRFRDYEISFLLKSETERKSKIKFTYTKLEKKFPDFKFSSGAGDIREGEVIGIVGKNAIGKSLFIKMLAGTEKPDKGEGASFSIAYKPQYLEPEKITVKDFLKTKKTIPSVLELCKRELKLNHLSEKKLNKLSGGELQRVFLARTLSTEADVYLFDEPSAFLDIEQRFAFSKLLKQVINDTSKSAFVVDHDIVFVDFISNRIIPFEGESSVFGHAGPPLPKKEGMNKFLSIVDITMRRDKDSNRPRINKPESQLDREQKSSGQYYYST
ncbi:MAG: ribosome biogenesis/translation initiation ATPase RLI [Candidatus ainarchaeum sp.]|nr:ribosome biogenesis/translation initiation ATPase RLI [Candidatus ainarchaeum sp.]